MADPTGPQTRPRARRAVAAPVVTDAPPVAAAKPARRSAAKPTPARPGTTADVEDLEDVSTNYALRLTQALEAISSVQSDAPSRRGLRPPQPTSEDIAPTASQDAPLPPGAGSLAARVLRGLDQLPPIRLPIGPAIPWRLAVPALGVLLAVMVFATRSTSDADSQGVRLPAPTPTVQPLFANSQAPLADGSSADPSAAQVPTAPPAIDSVSTPAPVGVQEPTGSSFDVLDIGLKLVAVLALAYGSLMLLKKTGFGTGSTGKHGSGPVASVRVVSTLVLAPNRAVHILRVPGGKTLVVGATLNQVNLIADLGVLPDEQDLPSEGSFFDVLKGKLAS